MESILVRLVNNDRIIGELITYTPEIIALWAPIMITESRSRTKDTQDYYIYKPYDILSETPMAVFDFQHVLTTTRPKKIIEEYFEEAKSKYYPKFEDYRKSMIEKYKLPTDYMDDGSFNPDRLNDMFSEFLNRDKKKLN